MAGTQRLPLLRPAPGEASVDGTASEGTVKPPTCPSG
jgi:hypothetical protein